MIGIFIVNNWIHTFPKGISVCEMQSISSRILTRVAVSISYDDNHYTMGTWVMVIGVCVLLHANAFRKGMNPYVPFATGK